MHYHFSFYSSLLLIFFTHGIVFSFLLLHKGITEQRRECKWLSLFTGLCSVYLLPFMLGFAGWYGVQPYRDILFYLPLQQTLLIGPAVYFYTKSLLNPRFEFSAKDWLHLVPAGLYMLYSLVIFVTDKLVLHEYFFYSNGRDKDLDTWYQVAGLLSMMFYSLLCIRYYLIYKKFIYQFISFADTIQLTWIRNFLTAFFFMVVTQLVFLLLFPGWGSFKQKWWYFFSFASLLYFIALKGYINKVQGNYPFHIYRLSHTSFMYLPGMASLLLPASEPEPIETTEQQTGTVNDNDDTIAAWKQKLEQLLLTEKIYKNPGLTLLDVAQLLRTHPAVISRMVNKSFKMNFNDWINSYRVKAVIEMLQQDAQKTQSLLGIALDCGFNSKTSFNRCFKKFTGLSPKDFMLQMGARS